MRHTDAGEGGPETLKLKQETNLPPVDDDGDGGYEPPEPEPDTYRLCFKFEVGFLDAGKTIIDSKGFTITEDHWSGVSKGSGKTLKLAAKFSPNMIVTGRGVMYSYKLGQFWLGPYYSDPASGCANISLSNASSIDLRVYSQFRDKDGNIVRVHDGIGDTFYWSTKVLSPKAGKTTTVMVGDYTGRSTLAATIGFSMYRWAYGNVGKQIDVAESSTCGTPDGAESSAHFDFSELDDGLAHIRVHDGTNPDCSASDHRRMKFVVSHELGHAWLLLRTKMDEPTVESTLNDPTETECGDNAEGYSLGSVEWSGIGFRESAAHLYATRVWNNRSTDAVFSWFAAPNFVEANPDYGDGGRLGNVCTTMNKAGKSTNIDWLRFWWDIYSPSGPDTIGSGNTIAQIYEDTVLNGGTSLVNYWEKLREAAVVRIPDPDVMARFDCASSWNGIDNSGTPVGCSIPTPP